MEFGIPSGSEIVSRSKETLARFPLAMMASLLAVCIALYLVETKPPKMEGIYLALAKVLLVSTLAVPALASARLFGEQVSRRWHFLGMLLVLLGMVLYYWVLPDLAKDFGASMVAFRHFFLSLLFLIALLWAPFAFKHLDNQDYWEYAKHVLFSFVMAFLFALVSIFGINGAIFAVEKLFDVDIAGKRYFQTDIVIVGLFSVGYFLSQFMPYPEQSRFTGTPPKVERFFAKWLLTPLSGLYFVILYAYTAKVLMALDWPKGILAWLVVIFSVVAILTYLFWTHFAKEEHGGWRRWIWLAVLLQTVMLFVAIGMRIMEYSWTESRYMVFVLGVWLAGVSLYYLLMPRARIKWIFISLSLLIAVTQFGPLSAYNVSRAAQEHRLLGLVKKLKTYQLSTQAPVKLRYEVSDGISYLYRRYRGESLEKIFPKITKAFEATQTHVADTDISPKAQVVKKETAPNYLPEYVTYKLGFKLINGWEYRSNKQGKPSFEFTASPSSIRCRDRMLDVKGYDYTATVGRYGYEMIEKGKLQDKNWTYSDPSISLVYTKDFRLTVQKGTEEVTFDLQNLLDTLVSIHGEASATLPKEALVREGQNGRLKVKLALDSLGKRYQKEIQLIHFSGVLFLGEVK